VDCIIDSSTLALITCTIEEQFLFAGLQKYYLEIDKIQILDQTSDYYFDLKITDITGT
jgi:hypothetical protein